MFYLRKRISISGAHSLSLPYASKCSNLHGHNWIIDVFCKSENLNPQGMVLDFSVISRIVKELDHENLNDYLEQPTAEALAKHLCEKIPYCYRVDVQETEGNVASYEV